MTLPPLQSAQCAWFVASVEGIRASALFNSIFDAEPDNVQNNKAPNPSAPFFSIASGKMHGLEFSFHVLPGRIDLHVSKDTSGGGDDYPIFESEPLFDFLRNHIVKVKIPHVLRCAVIANFLKMQENLSDSTNEFIQTIGVDLPMDSLTDLAFQVNRRGVLPCGVNINRLLRFSTVVMQSFVIEVGRFEHARGAHSVSSQQFGNLLSIDCNTVPDGAFFNESQIPTIFTEQIAEVLRIAVANKPAALADGGARA